MKIFTFLPLLAISLAVSTQDRLIVQHDQINQYPDSAHGAKVARTLVNRESIMNVNTIQNSSGVAVPISSMEYYADCDRDGNPYWLVIDIGSPARNIASGSTYSFTIRAGDHPEGDHVRNSYPGGIPSSPAGSPRLTLRGQIVEVENGSPGIAQLEKCFLRRHPDASWWLPSKKNTPHEAHWVKIMVSDVYMVGGFGDRAYIGPVTGEEYQAAEIIG